MSAKKHTKSIGGIVLSSLLCGGLIMAALIFGTRAIEPPLETIITTPGRCEEPVLTGDLPAGTVLAIRTEAGGTEWIEESPFRYTDSAVSTVQLFDDGEPVTLPEQVPDCADLAFE